MGAGPAVLEVKNTSTRRQVQIELPRTDLGDIVVVAPVVVSGTIIDGELPPQPNRAYIVEIHDADGQVQHAMTSEGSRFSAKVPRGPTVLLVRPGRSAARIDPGVLARVEVEAPAADLRIELDKPSGQLRGDLPAKVTGDMVDIALYPYFETGERGVAALFNSMKYEREPVKESGFLLGAVPPGVFDVHIQCGAAGSAWLVGVTVTAGSMTDVGEVRVGTGRLVRSDDDSAAASGVMARTLSPFLVKSLVEGDPGEVLELQAGPWLLFPRGVPATRSHGRLVDIHVGEDFVWDGESWVTPGALSGAVLVGGVPRPDVEMRLSTFRHEESLGANSQVATRRTDAQGLFVFEEVLPGEYALGLDGMSSQEKIVSTVTVANGVTTEWTMDLPAASTHLHLRFEGQPLDHVANLTLFWRQDGSTRRWIGYPEGAWAEVPSVPGPAWVVVTRGPSVHDAFRHGYDHAALLAALPVGGSLEVDLPTHAVIVEMSEAAVRPPWPTLHVAFDDAADSFELQWRPTRLPDGRRSCEGLPTGATLDLSGFDADGRKVQQQVIVPVGRTVVSWP